MDNFLNVEDLQDLEGDVNYQVIKGLPFEYFSAPHCIYGAPSSAKSAFIMSLALHYTVGQNFLGYELTEPGNILYIDFDGNRIGRTVGKLTRGYGLEINAKAFKVSNPQVPHPPIKQVNDYDFQNNVSQAIDDIRKETGLINTIVIIDTLNGLCSNTDENSSEIGQHLTNLTELSKKDPHKKSCFILLHHTGKKGSSERGSSAIRGICASMTSITCTVKDGKKTYTLETDKDRIDPQNGWNNPTFKFHDIEFRDERPYASRLELVSDEEPTEKSLYSKINDILLSTEKSGLTSMDLSALTHARKESIIDMLKQLESENKVVMEKIGKKQLWSSIERMQNIIAKDKHKI